MSQYWSLLFAAGGLRDVTRANVTRYRKEKSLKSSQTDYLIIPANIWRDLEKYANISLDFTITPPDVGGATPLAWAVTSQHNFVGGKNVTIASLGQRQEVMSYRENDAVQ